MIKKVNLLLKVILGVLVLLVVFVIVATFSVKGIVSEEYLVEKIEESINSEVEIGGVYLSLFSSPAKISLSDVSLTPKDGGDPNASVKIDQLELDVSFWQLFKKHIDVSKISIKKAEITSTYFEDGSSSLDQMFSSPEKEKRKKKKGASSKDGDDDEDGFNVFDQEDFVASLGSLVIEDSVIDLTLEKTGLRVRGEDLHIELSSIKIDPNDLRATNTAKVTMSSLVTLHSVEGWHYGDLHLRGEASANIFNPETGNTEPNIEGRIDLGDNSWLNTHIPVITKAWEKLDVLEKVGIKVAELPKRATFGRSQAVAVHYHLGKITVRETLSILVGDWELAALKDSWLQTETDQHEMEVELVASERASGKFLDIIKAVDKLVPQELADRLIADIQGKIFRDDRLMVKVSSTGEFSDPKIRPVEGVPDIYEEAKDAGKDLLKEKAVDLLRGFLEK